MKLTNLFIAAGIACFTLSSCEKEPDPVKGCTAEDAINYSPDATADDGTCKHVAEKQTPIVSKTTATWCPPCGGWGWTLFGELYSAVHGKALIFTTYGSSSSKMYHKTAGDFYSSWAPGAGWPAFTANGKNETQYSAQGGIYTGLTKERVLAVVDSTVAVMPVVNTGFTVNKEGDEWKITSKTKFFKPTSGEYYLGFYVIEDKVMEVQAGHPEGNNTKVEHHHVLRAPVTSSFGDMIASGDIAAGEAMEKNASITINPDWNPANTYIVAMLFKKEGAKYNFVNASFAIE